MTFTTRPIDPSRPFARIVENLSLTALSSEDVRQHLRQLWAEHGLLIFRGDTDPSFHLELSRVFGPLEPHAVRELRVEGHPELFLLRHSPEIDPWLYDVGGEIKGAWIPWHFDLAFAPHSNRGAMLRSVTLPRTGGNTGFIAGMDDLSGGALLSEIVDHITADHRAYYHVWQGDELLLWDNWRMLHCACGVPDGETREMHRTTISAPHEIGRYLESQAT